MSVRGQVDEPGCGGAEAAGIEVEPGEMLFEVHVQPLASGRLGVPGSVADKRRGDPLPLILTGDLDVKEEGVITPSHATLTKPTRPPSGRRAVTQPRLWGRI